MIEDNEGFLYPKVDESLCVDCGLCNQVCPIQNSFTPNPPIKVLAAYNKNEEIRRESSSGGVFTILAEKVIDEGGIVFGATFNEQWEVILSYSESKEGIAQFRGSKYVQADVKDSFKQCEQFLKKGRKVLFSGTPCQIAGLKRYLGKEYEHLLTIDVVCHGVPSPKVWRKYLFCIRKNAVYKSAVRRWLEKVPFCSSRNTLPLIQGIRFRDKSDGWKKFRFVLSLAEASAEGKQSTVLSSSIINECHHDNLFMQAFLSDLILRPSCYSCPFRGIEHRQADMSIADYWGVDVVSPEIDDDKGISLILLNTQKGVTHFPTGEMFSKEANLNQALNYNGGLQPSIRQNPRRANFFRELDSVDVIKLISHNTRFNEPTIPLWRKVARRVKDYMKRY